MQNDNLKILVLFVEPMLYGIDLINEVYEKTSYTFRYIYCNEALTGKDKIKLPENSFICSGKSKQRKAQIIKIFNEYNPDFAVINGYVGFEQTISINYCIKNKIPYSIETDTPLHIPENKIKAFLKKIYLNKLLNNKYCFGFPGGTLQKENLIYYGIPEAKNYIMPMSVSSGRILEAANNFSEKSQLKEELGIGGKKVFLFVGRLEKVKNVELLINAFGKMKKQNNNIALIIAGDGSEMETLKNRVRDNKISDVLFAGYAVFPQNIKLFKTADVFVLPSSYEPWGLVVNEAMIMGLPVIVSSAVGCRKDLIVDGNNGYIFADGNENDLLLKMQSVDNLKKTKNMTDSWNYKFYLECFNKAVKQICRK